MVDEDDEDDDNCETCGGSGEIGPSGWEYPEWDTCPDCRGGGLRSDADDPDRKFDEARDG